MTETLESSRSAFHAPLSRRGLLVGSAAIIGAAALTEALDWSRPAAAAATAAPVLYRRQIRRARPGEAFVLAGAGFALDARARASVVSGEGPASAAPPRNSLPLTVVAVTADAVVLALPASAPLAAYAVWVSASGGTAWSSPLTVNAPSAWFVDTPRASTGDTVTVFGESLRLGRATPAISLVPVRGGRSVAVRVTDANGYRAAFRVDGCAAGDYTVRVAGDAGPYPTLTIGARPAVPRQVFDVVRRFGADPTGARDATAAVQSALDAAAAATGGGVVSIPRGTFTISAKLTVAPAKGTVVIRGAGRGATTIRMSDAVSFSPSLPKNSPTDIYGISADDDYGMLYLAPDDRPVEVLALTFDANQKRILAIGVDGRHGSTIADVGVESPDYPASAYLYVGTHSILAQNARDLTVERCDLHASNGVFLIAVVDTRVQDSTFRLALPRKPHDPGNPQSQADDDGVKIWGARRVTVRRNHFQRGSDTFYYARAVQTGGYKLPAQTFGIAEAGGVEDCYYGDNTIVAAGEPASNCGEVLVGDQFTSVQGGRILLRASAATASTISTTDATFLLDDPKRDPRGAMVVILSGAGVGQLRRVVSNSASTLTLDEPWDVVPGADSTFVVTVLQQRQLYVGNTATACPKYIGNYGPSAFCIVGRNSFDSTGSVEANPPGFEYSGFLFTGIVTGDNPSTIDVSLYNQIVDNVATRGAVSLIYDDFSTQTLANPLPPIVRNNLVADNASSGDSAYAVRLKTLYGTPNPGRPFGELNQLIRNTPPTGSGVAVQDSVWHHTVYQGPAGGLTDGGSATIIV